MSGDLACTYAALILSDDGQEVTAEKMDTIIKAAPPVVIQKQKLFRNGKATTRVPIRNGIR